MSDVLNLLDDNSNNESTFNRSKSTTYKGFAKTIRNYSNINANTNENKNETKNNFGDNNEDRVIINL
jgi:hypothetical protein